MKTEFEGTIEVPIHVLLTIRRPNGEIEKVEATPGGMKAINDKIFAQLVKANKAAGRGDVLSYQNVKKTKNATVKLTSADVVGMESDRLEKMMAYGEK